MSDPSSGDIKAPPHDDKQGLPTEPQSRREFLETSALGAAGLLVGCSGDDTQPPLTSDAGDAGLDAAIDGPTGDADPDASLDATPDAMVDADLPIAEDPYTFMESPAFSLGVASGDVSYEAAVLWTRYDGRAEVELRLWRFESERYLGPILHTRVAPDDAGFVHYDVSDLSAGAQYRYAFFELDAGEPSARSMVGSFRAAIAPDSMENLVIGATCCTKNGRSMATLEEAARRDELDLFLLLGDTTYNDDARTAAQFRERWAENLGTDGYRALRARTSVLATWDDHEVTNNFNPETTSGGLLNTARDAFFQHLPLRRDASEPGRIWKSARWGQTLEIFVLDTRGERRPSTIFRDDIYISREQMDWLKAGLRDSPAVFKLIMNSVPIANFPFAFDFAANDRWEGYRSQRNEILSFIDTYIDGAFWVAGDFHLACVAQVETRGMGSSQLEFLVGPGAQTANPLWSTLTPPQFIWTSGESNYTSFSLEPVERRMTVTYHSGDGRVLETRSYEV